MSFCINVYVPVKGVSYITGLYDTEKRTSSAIRERLDFIDSYFHRDYDENDRSLYTKYLCELFGYYSDEDIKGDVLHETKHHNLSAFKHETNLKKNRRRRKEVKHIFDVFSEHVQIYNSIHTPHKYIVVDSIAYRQGWFCKKSFFKRNNTTYYATDKKTAYRIMRNLFDNSERAREAFNYFTSVLETLEDNKFIFELAW